MSAVPLPNFLVIGAQRTATSWLYFCLKEHPDVYVPYIKEVGYFTESYGEGPEWYRRYFEQWKGQKAVGEVTPAYLYREGTAERIARDLPEVKLVVNFRNPIDRAYSQYRKHVRAGAVTVDFETALAADPEYVDRGRYYEQLVRYVRLFPRERILTLVYEDIRKDPVAHFRTIAEYLGVDPSFTPPSAASVIPSEDLGSGLYRPVSGVTGFLRRAGLGAAVDAVKRTPVRRGIDGLLQKFGPSPRTRGAAAGSGGNGEKMRPETRERLRKLFEPENEKLAKFLGRDLSFWK